MINISKPVNTKMSGIRKSTILLKLLGQKISYQVSKHLSMRERQKIDKYQSKVDRISNDEVDTVLIEFNNYFDRLKYEINNANPLIWITEIILILLVVLLTGGILFLFSKNLVDNKPVEAIIKNFFSSNGIYLLIFPIIAYFCQNYFKMGPIRLVFHKMNIFNDTLYGIIVGISLFFLLSFTFILPDNIYLDKPKGIYLVLSVISIVFLGPMIEEILFRKWLYPLLRGGLGIITSIMLVSLIFALLHGLNSWLYFGATFISGIALTYLYQKRNSLYACFLAHAIANLGSFLLLF